MTQFSRRSIAKGASWSVPIIASTSMVPATAASNNCQPVLDYSGGFLYHWGVVNGSSKTTQVYNEGAGQVNITNLSPNVTVTKVVVSRDILRREGQDSEGPGILFAGNSSATFANQTTGFTPKSVAEALSNLTTTNDPAFNISPAYPVSGSGYDPLVSMTNDKTVNFNGKSATAWNLTYTWTAARNTLANTYTNNGTCRNFTTNSSGRYNITYKNMTSNSSSAVKYIQFVTTVTATLSDGNVLTLTNFTQS